MHVSRLQLHDFRNYASAELRLGPGAQLFVGANGQGKTNLVEAVGYLATLSSHRVSSDAALVRLGCESAVVRAELAHGDRRLRIEVQIAKSGSNRAQVGGRQVRARELSRYFASVLFAPEDLALVRGEPAARRAFLDGLLTTHSPRLASVLGDYDRVLRQRGALLRSMRGGRASEGQLGSLAVWDERLLELGSEIMLERVRLVARLEPHLAAAYERLVGADHLPRLSMRLTAYGHGGASVGDESEEDVDDVGADVDVDGIRARFAQRLAEVREREIDRGSNLVGPHRDDAVFWLNGLPARITASHGESWSFALSLKLAAAQLVRSESFAGDPVLILDDVFAELDDRRRERLAHAIGDFEQVLITAAVLGDVPEALRERVIRIERGVIHDERGDVDAAHAAEGGRS